ncbi:MAG: recombinase family protein [Clostridia bacterium]|nr:recombinase family protein [Clostridia bacterium]
MYGYYTNRLNESRKAAIYARVSTEHEEQLSALENQKDWYKPILEQHPEWDIVEMYVDEGVTGTSAKKRKNFMRMIADAERGKFDLILTREVSRFARNTVDTLQYTRSLKAKGVEVYFINDNIKTFDGDGELRLTIMATLAQDESRKTSIRVKAGQQTSMGNGVYYGNGSILGYDRVGKKMVINPEQAKTVRMIYDWYLAGEGIRSIQFKLEQSGRLTAMGKTTWHMTNISKILKNTFYCGIITYHKQWTPDYLEQKKINNHGEIEYTVVQGTHEPIVTVEEFETVQKIFKKHQREHPESGAGQRREYGNRKPIDIWTELLICECGHHFNRRIWHRESNYNLYSYQCYGSIKTGTVRTRINKGMSTEGICRVPMFPSWKLEMMAKHIFQEFSNETEPIVDLALSILDKHIDDKEKQVDNTDLIRQYNDEKEKLQKRLDNLIEMRADGESTKEIFQTKSSEIKSRIQLIDDELAQLGSEKEKKQSDYTHEERISLLKYHLLQTVYPGDGKKVSEGVLRAFVSKIVAHEDTLDWYLRFRPDDNTATGEPQKITEFTFTLENAKEYLYSFSPQRRVLKWTNIKAAVYI